MGMLDNRVAIVTGAGRGIGSEVAQLFAANGASVVVNDLGGAVDGTGGEAGPADDTVAAIRDAGGNAVANYTSVADYDGAEGIIQQALDEYGRLDILVNNAGIYPAVPWDDLTLEEWRRVMAVNLDAVFLTSKAAYGPMRDRGYGRIINIASDVILAGTPHLAHYVASKGGVFAFTRALATELGPYGITANSVAPGLTDTEGVRGSSHADTFEWVVSMQAIARRGTADDIAPAIAFLASEEAGWITGSMIVVNGGKERH